MQRCVRWAFQVLDSSGDFEVIQDTPYSFVARIRSKDAYYYVKQTPPLLALESTITVWLKAELGAHVPVIVASDDERHCFLMQDAGVPLRTILKKQFDLEQLKHAMFDFMALQRKLENQFDQLLAFGVPDWRLDKIPMLYYALLHEEALLQADGLKAVELQTLKENFSSIQSLCEDIAAYGVKPSLVQPDFHDNNILFNEAETQFTFIDLGEIAISHPFFSLVGCLYQAKKHHALTDADEQKLTKACLSAYECQEKIINDVKALWPVYGALATYRLIEACGIEKMLTYQAG